MRIWRVPREPILRSHSITEDIKVSIRTFLIYSWQLSPHMTLPFVHWHQMTPTLSPQTSQRNSRPKLSALWKPSMISGVRIYTMICKSWLYENKTPVSTGFTELESVILRKLCLFFWNLTLPFRRSGNSGAQENGQAGGFWRHASKSNYVSMYLLTNMGISMPKMSIDRSELIKLFL